MRFLAGFLMAILVMMAGISDAAEYSATMVTESSQGIFENRVFVKGPWQRHEQAGAIILLNDETGVTYSIIPSSKSYMQMEEEEASSDPSDSIISKKIEVGEVFKDEDGSIERLPLEKINGYTCDIYVHTPDDPEFGKSTIWYSPDLKAAIKVVAKTPMGDIKMHYRDIKEEKQDEGLFVLPEGYKKMEMPF